MVHQDAQSFTPPQTHIFITGFQAFCVGKGSLLASPELVGALEALLRKAAAAPLGDRDARHILATFAELVADPTCPEAVRELVAPRADRQGNRERAEQGAPSDKLRRSVKMFETAEAVHQ